MRSFETQQHSRSTRGEAIRVTRLICAFAALGVASRASAQGNPLLLPTQHVTVPRAEYATGQKATINGLILSRNGDDMTIRNDNGTLTVATLTADTKIESPSGLFSLDRSPRDATSLLPGLIVQVKGVGGDRNNLVADKVTFRSSALKVAQQIAAGTLMLSHRVDANKDAFAQRITDSLDQVKSRLADSIDAITMRTRDSLEAIGARFDDLDDYDLREKATVNFATGSAELSDADKQQLDALVDAGTQLKGYLVEVTGYADATGTTMFNQRLSTQRADAVVQYLTQIKNVPVRRILNPTGFGETQPVASNGTAAGRAMNRRAEVRVLVNKGAQ
jgi:outer membrane protein OmpA-like peptidoglycan-associated protein